MDRNKAVLFTGCLCFFARFRRVLPQVPAGKPTSLGRPITAEITIVLETLPQLPATGWWSLALLAVSIGMLLAGRQNLRVKQASTLY